LLLLMPRAAAGDRTQLFAVLSGQQQLPDSLLRGDSGSGSGSSHASAAEEEAARKVWDEAGAALQAHWAAASSSGSSGSGGGSDGWWSGQQPASFDEAAQAWQQLLVLAGQAGGPSFAQVLLGGAAPGGGSSSSSDDAGAAAVPQQLARLQQALARATGLSRDTLAAVQGFASTSSSSSSGGAGGADSGSSAAGLEAQLRPLLQAPPTLDQLLQQHWDKVAQAELGVQPSSSSSCSEGDAAAAAVPNWPQLWQLLQQLTHHAAAQQQQQQQRQQAQALAGGRDSSGALDAASLFERYQREAEAVPLTPQPYPGVCCRRRVVPAAQHKHRHGSPLHVCNAPHRVVLLRCVACRCWPHTHTHTHTCMPTGARRLLHWEQRMVLHAASGDTVMPAELKVKLAVSAAELAHEAGLSRDGLQFLLAVAGDRCVCARLVFCVAAASACKACCDS
jgi:hypothetical protein